MLEEYIVGFGGLVAGLSLAYLDYYLHEKKQFDELDKTCEKHKKLCKEISDFLDTKEFIFIKEEDLNIEDIKNLKEL